MDKNNVYEYKKIWQYKCDCGHKIFGDTSQKNPVLPFNDVINCEKCSGQMIGKIKNIKIREKTENIEETRQSDDIYICLCFM